MDQTALFRQLLNFHASHQFGKDCGVIKMEETEGGYECYFETTSELVTTNDKIVKKSLYKFKESGIWVFEAIAYRKKLRDFVREHNIPVKEEV